MGWVGWLVGTYMGGLVADLTKTTVQTNPIVLGTRALRSLYVVLDLENHRVRPISIVE